MTLLLTHPGNINSQSILEMFTKVKCVGTKRAYFSNKKLFRNFIFRRLLNAASYTQSNKKEDIMYVMYLQCICIFVRTNTSFHMAVIMQVVVIIHVVYYRYRKI